MSTETREGWQRSTERAESEDRESRDSQERHRLGAEAQRWGNGAAGRQPWGGKRSEGDNSELTHTQRAQGHREGAERQRTCRESTSRYPPLLLGQGEPAALLLPQNPNPLCSFCPASQPIPRQTCQTHTPAPTRALSSAVPLPGTPQLPPHPSQGLSAALVSFQPLLLLPILAPITQEPLLTKDYNTFYSHAAVSQSTNTRQDTNTDSPPTPTSTPRLLPTLPPGTPTLPCARRPQPCSDPQPLRTTQTRQGIPSLLPLTLAPAHQKAPLSRYWHQLVTTTAQCQTFQTPMDEFGSLNQTSAPPLLRRVRG